MCIAIFKKPTATISDETLFQCFKSNGDGCGFAYINTDHLGRRKIVIKKTMSFEKFLQKYHRALRVAPESPFLIHFRIRTHGVTTIFNCHPFQIDKNHVFIHNGVISGMRPDKEKSDTQIFNEDYLQQLPQGWFSNRPILDLIERSISFNKMVFMNIDGEVAIINEDKGTWDKNIWYSNNTYKPTKIYNYVSNNNSFGYQHQTKDDEITVDSKVTCDNCAEDTVLKDSSYYYYMGVCCVYCKKCKSKDTTRVLSQRGQIITPSCYIDWLNDEKSNLVNTHSFTLVGWDNPWNTSQDYSNYLDRIYSEDYNVGNFS